MEQEVKSEDTDFDLHIFYLDIFPLASHQLLERKYLLFSNIPANGFAVEHEALGFWLDPSV